MTEKHQDLQVYHLTCKNYFGSNQICKYQRVVLDNEKCIKTLIGYDKLKFYKWLIYENMEYHLLRQFNHSIIWQNKASNINRK